MIINRLNPFEIPKEIFISQALGAILFLIIGVHEFWFINLWLGGVFAMPIGLSICVIKDRSFVKTRNFFLGAATFVACLLIIPFIIMHDEVINDFRSIEASAISEIKIYNDKWDSEPIVAIKDPELIAEFVEKSKDATGYDNLIGGSYVDQFWYIVIKRNTMPIEMEVGYLEDNHEKIKGYFIQVGQRSYSVLDDFTSEGLNIWFDKVRNIYGF